MAGGRGRRRRATGVLLGLLFCGSAEAQAPPNGKAAGTKEKEETCRISGMVVKLADGTPLKNATVQLTNDSDREHIIATQSGSDGRFALKNVPAGRYKLVVSRSGYVSAEYGQKKPADPGGVFALAFGGGDRGTRFRRRRRAGPADLRGGLARGLPQGAANAGEHHRFGNR